MIFRKRIYPVMAQAVALAVVLVGSSGFAFADEVAGRWAAYQFDLGVTAHHELYEEFAPDGAKFMQEEATLLGLKGALQRPVGWHGLLRAEVELDWGRARYTGAYQNGEYGDLHVSGLRRSLYEGTLAYRQNIPAWGGFWLSGGLGYRQLVDNLQDGGDGGYKRTNDRFYALAGLGYDFETSHWTVTPAAQYKPSLWSQNISDMTAVDGDTVGITHDQKKGWGAELSMTLTQKGVRHPLVVRPFWRMWKMEDSNVVSGYYEPRNTTNETGLDVSVRF